MKSIHSIYYHNPNPNGVEKMIIYHLKMGYRFISLAELYEILKQKITPKEKLAFVSLDDGWLGNLSLLPVIEKYKVPICIFVATEPIKSGNFWWEYVCDAIGRKGMLEYKKLPYMDFYSKLKTHKSSISLERSALTKNDVILLGKHPLVTIQSHSVNHPILTNVPSDILEMELNDSKIELENLIKREVYAFSYPNGSLSKREVDACKNIYSMAFTTEQRNISISDDIYMLPRYALTGNVFRDLLKIWGIWKLIKRIKL